MKTINNTKKFKKWIIAPILGLICVFTLFTTTFNIKTKAANVVISPITSLDDIPTGAIITFNQNNVLSGMPTSGRINGMSNSSGVAGPIIVTTNGNNVSALTFSTTSITARIGQSNTQILNSNGFINANYRTWQVVSTLYYYPNTSVLTYDNSDQTLIDWLNNNATITIEQTVPQIQITLNANGGYFETGGGDQVSTLTANADVGDVSSQITYLLGTNDLINYGYNFLGWSLSANDATTLTTSELNSLNTNTTLYAVWQASNTVLIQFNANTTDYTGTTPNSEYVSINNYYNLPNNPGNLAKANYDFMGWATTPNATYNDVVSTYYVTEATTFYAVWQIQTKTLTLNLGGGDLPGYTTNTFNYNYGTTVNLATFGTPVKTSYIFLGWGTSATATEFITNVTMTTNKTVYAIWGTATQDFATITFNGNGNTGGAVPGSVTVIKGTTYTLPFNPGELVKTGYTFLGWSLASDSLTTFETVTPTTNITVYAVWAELQYANVILKINNETVATCKVYNLGYATYTIKFGEFSTEYFKINITAQDGFTADNINYNWLWSVYYNAEEHKATITYTFNGEHVTQINFTNNSGVTTEYDAASLDLMRPPNTLLVYYENSATYTIDIITTPNTEIDSMRTIIGGIASSMQALLDINIGWFSLGALAAVVISIGVLFFVFKIARGGGNG